MSLDIWLCGPAKRLPCACQCGHTHRREHRETLWETNITHNLVPMAKACGLYVPMWRPEEAGFRRLRAGNLVPLLYQGLEKAREKEQELRRLEPENGWGSYDGLVRVATDYWEACRKYRWAHVRLSR